MRLISVVAFVAACGSDVAPATPVVAEPIPTRVRLLTDSQYANAIRDLVGDVTPALPVHVPGTQPHQFHHDGLVAVDAALLAQYRIAAESIGREVARRPFACVDRDLECARAQITQLTERAFRRPLETDELDQLVGIYALTPTAADGWGYVVETVLQAPSFIYRTERGAEGSGVVALTEWELAAELGFWLLDSIPDEGLVRAARDGSILRPDGLEAVVERLLADPRVQARVDDMVLDWLGIRRVFGNPYIDAALEQSMFDESAGFVHDVLWSRGGGLRTLLTSTESVVDDRLAAHYGAYTGMTSAHRAGILTHASVLTAYGKLRVSIIARGVFIHRALLCTEDLGRPPFSAIAAVSDLTYYMSDSQFAHYRAADLYCSGCHRIIDPPGRAFLAFDHAGVWRTHDENNVPIESDTLIEVDGRVHRVDGAPELARLLANSDQVARCVVDQFTHHALGARLLDESSRRNLYEQFTAGDRDLVELVRSIATSPAFRMRGAP